jgi:hypothetical protein
MAAAYDAIAIAESIARHGYFESEPLVAVPYDAAYPGEKRGERSAEYVVVEGNRRLTALRALTDPDFRGRLKGRRWAALPAKPDLPADYPVLVVARREQVAPILGFRHITGIAPWAPYPQARYIAELVDQEGRTFPEVSELLNRSETEVKSAYRNYWVGEQAAQGFGIEDSDRIIDSFGVFTRAMQNPPIRAYIGAPDPAAVTADFWPLPEEKKDALEELVTWLFGKPRKEGDRDTARPRPGQVLLDSRHITDLGTVLSSPRGVQALKSGSPLAEAEELIRDPRAQAIAALSAAGRSLETAAAQQDQTGREALERVLNAIEDALSEI